jgi:molybdate transport system substrate-binding protein
MISLRALRYVSMLVGLAAVLLLATGCRSQAPARARLTIRGGPSLDPLFAELARAYQQQNPDVELVCEFSCPPCIILKRDGLSRDMDLFASLGQFELDSLKAGGHFTFPEARTMGSTRLVLATSQRLKSPVRNIADLLRSSTFKVGMGDPETVGVGYYARQALQRSGLWGELQGRIVLSQSGCELLKWLSLGRDIEAALVFGVCMTPDHKTLLQVHGFPSDVIPPVPLILALSGSAQNVAEARQFMDFCLSAEARPILARYNVKPDSVAVASSVSVAVAPSAPRRGRQ